MIDFTKRNTFLFITSSLIGLCSFSIARAQELTASSEVGEVVVTASRVTAGFAAPTPTTVVGVEQVQARGFTNIADALNQVPAFRATHTTASSARGGALFGGSYLDLRGLNGQHSGATARTLVLVDGRRHVPSTASGQVDLNMIPTSLVQRTEVVTGGASAAWGSDAVAGVVNLILKDRLQGVEGSAGFGQSSRGDFTEYSATLAGGTSFAGGRGQVIAGIDYLDNKGVPDSSVSREWGRAFPGTVTLPAVRPAGVPRFLIANGVYTSDRMTPGGIIVGGPLDNIQFLPGGATSTFVPSTLVGGNVMLGGPGFGNVGISGTPGSYLVNPLSRYAALARARYEFSDGLSAFVEVSQAESKFNGTTAQRRDDGSLTIARDNAFLPEDIRSRMTGLNLQNITVGRIAYDNGYGYFPQHTDQKTQRFVVGAQGKLSGKWTWDAYYQVGKNRYVQNNPTTLTPNYLAAIDAVRDAGGNIVCRPGARLQAADPGCVPFNIFGQNSPSAAAIRYVTGVGVNDVAIQQNAAALNVRGDLFNLPAGAVAVAVGLEYRKEEANSTVDANSFASRFDLNNFKPILGKYNTKEAYAEVAAPLLRDAPGAKSLEVNAAIRHTNYSTSGPVTTWKIGFTYEPFADLRFRGTKSRDIRAANINELYQLGTQSRGSVINPRNGLTAQVDTFSIGDPTLTPEKANTYTGGVVYQPSWLSGFRASVDYYDIVINDVISRLLPQQVVDLCHAGQAALCADVVYDSTNTIQRLTVRNRNFNKLATNGFDIEVSYRLPTGFLGIPGSVNLRALGNNVMDLATTDTAGTIDRAGETVPKWSWNFATTYNVDRLTLNAQVRYVGEKVIDITRIGPEAKNYTATDPNSTNKNLLPPIAYVDLSAQVDLIKSGERSLVLFGMVNNLFDMDPPLGGTANQTSPVPYDLVGRAYRLGLRFKY